MVTFKGECDKLYYTQHTQAMWGNYHFFFEKQTHTHKGFGNEF